MAEDQYAVAILLRAGADIHARDASGLSCLHFAVQKGLSRVHHPLPSPHSSIFSLALVFLVVCHLRWAEFSVGVEICLLAGIPVDILDAEGRTPLHWATMIGAVAVVRQLVQNGASLVSFLHLRSFHSPIHPSIRPFIHFIQIILSCPSLPKSFAF